MLSIIVTLLGVSMQSPHLKGLAFPESHRAPVTNIFSSSIQSIQMLDEDETIDWNELGLVRPSSLYLPRESETQVRASRRRIPVRHQTTERKLISFGPSGLQLAVSLVMRRPKEQVLMRRPKEQARLPPSPIVEKAQEDITVKVPAKKIPPRN